MPEAVHRTPDQTTRSTGLTLSAAHAGTRFWQPLRPTARRLSYAITVLLGWVAVLTLYDTIGEAFGTGVPRAAMQVSFIVERFFNYLISLAPAMVFISLIRGVFPNHPYARIFFFAIGAACSAAAGIVINDILVFGADTQWLLTNPRDVAEGTIAILFPVALLVTAYEFYRRGEDVADAAFRIHADRIALQAEVSKARLQLLRAQIEPHFIFNSLAHVRRLYQIDTEAARKLLDNLVRYFTGALPSLRRETCSLAEELALIDAYLAIHRLRMPSRLEYEIVFPEELLARNVPSMILLTLVENAIKHGVSPLPQGGFVHVSAKATGSGLELCVTDSGHGMTVSSGSGTGLSNIRARLVTSYGDAASLSLTTNKPSGIIATVRLPPSA